VYAANHIDVWRQDPTNRLAVRILEFVRLVRGNGFQVGVQEELDALIIAKHCNVMDYKRLHWGLRSLLCSNNNEWERFDNLFFVYWSRHANRKDYVQGSNPGGELAKNADLNNSGNSKETKGTNNVQQNNEGDEPVGKGGTRFGASEQETHMQTDFRFLTDNQQMQLMELMVERLAKRMRRRLIRRFRNRQRGQRINLRRTFRNSLEHGGTPMELVFKQRHRRLPRLILLLDVSRSMSFYSYLFLRFARGIIGAFNDSYAFIFHTHLVHVTDALHEPNINIVTQRLALLSTGWAGGTRIGDCLQTFNQDYAGRIVNSKSIVMIFSDGLDTGTPESLTGQMKIIKQRAKKIVWLNPLLGRDGYEPTARCMQAALPLIDLFAPAHNLESLLALEPQLAKV